MTKKGLMFIFRAKKKKKKKPIQCLSEGLDHVAHPAAPITLGS